jgi:hypothetical protein
MSLAPTKIKLNARELEVVDIPTMYRMSDEQYREFVKSGELLYVDHHDVLRSYVADYPLATSQAQLDILIEELHRLRGKLPAEGGNKL